MRRSQTPFGIIAIAASLVAVASAGILVGQTGRDPGQRRFAFAGPLTIKGSQRLAQPRGDFAPTHAAFVNHTLDKYPDSFLHLGKNFGTFFMSEDMAAAHIHADGKSYKQDLLRVRHGRDAKDLFSAVGPDKRTHWFRIYQDKPRADGSALGWAIEWPEDEDHLRDFIQEECQVRRLTWKDAKQPPQDEDFQVATWVRVPQP